MFLRTLRPQILFALATTFLACLGNSFSSTQAADPKKAFVLGDDIAPFTPPALADLEKSVEWVDRPVLDGFQLMRERQAAEKPLATASEAVKLRNDSPVNNAKILSALGRLPADDKVANFDANINRHSGGDVNSLNPILSSSVVESDITGLTGIGLFGFDWNMTPFASKDSVVSWKASKDGLYDKVVMRNDMLWSDGKPITAHDIVFSFKAIMSSQVPVPAQRSGTDKLKWVEAYDDFTLVFFHKESLAVNNWNLNFSIIPKHIYEPTIAADPTLKQSDAHLALEEKPVVGGPYIVTARTRGQEIVLQRRDDYFMFQGKQVRDKPYFKTIRFRIRPDQGASLLAMKAGDIDEMILTPEQWRNQTNKPDFEKSNTKAYGLEWTEFHFIWNCNDPRFSDKRVRQAMSWAFDHKELLIGRRFGMDEPCTGVFHSASRWAPKPALKPYTQNTDKAEALLAEAGWEDTDKNGILDKKINGKKVEFEFSVLTSNRPDRIETCNLLKESLDGLGIRVTVKAMDFPVLITKMTNHEFQAAFGGWGSGADPYTTENIFKTGEERNYGLYSNPEVDKLFAAGLKEFDLEKRTAIYQKIHTLLYEDQPYTWLYYQTSYYGFNKSLRGYVYSPRGPYHYSPGFSSIWKPLAP